MKKGAYGAATLFASKALRGYLSLTSNPIITKTSNYANLSNFMLRYGAATLLSPASSPYEFAGDKSVAAP